MDNYIYDSLLKKIEILSKALDKATERSRIMLYVVTFFSLLVIITTFNAYLSWERKLNSDERVLLAEELKLIPPSALRSFNVGLVRELNTCGLNISIEHFNDNTAAMLNMLKKNTSLHNDISKAIDAYIDTLIKHNLVVAPSDFFKLYMERQRFTIPIIGLSCYADDVYLIGALGLLILLTYSFFSLRRENRIIDKISKLVDYIHRADMSIILQSKSLSLNEADLIKNNLMEYVFYGCSEFFIFNLGKTSIDLKHKRNDDSTGMFWGRSDINSSGRIVLSFIYTLPVIAIIFSLTFEVKSLIERQFYLNGNDFFELIVRYTLTILFLFGIIIQCQWLKELNKSNSILIDKMYHLVEESKHSIKEPYIN